MGNKVMDRLQELSLNKFAVKFQRKYAIKFQGLHMNLSSGSNVVRFQIPSVPMSKSVSVRSLRDLFRNLFPVNSAGSSTERTARPLKTQGSSVALFNEQCYNVPELKCVNVPRTV